MSRRCRLRLHWGLYRRAFDERFATAAALTYIALGWGDEEAQLLCAVIESGALAHTRDDRSLRKRHPNHTHLRARHAALRAVV